MMNTMEHNNLKNLLENITEQPSKGCWSNIESQLNLLYPGAAAQSAVQGSSSAASKSGSFFAKIAAAPFKAAAITGSVAIVSTVSIIAIHSYNKIQVTPGRFQKMDQNTQVVTPQDTFIENNTTFEESKPNTSQANISRKEIEPTSVTAITPQMNNSNSQNVVQVNHTPNINNTIAQKPQNTVEKPISSQKPLVNQVIHQQDPVLKDQDIPESIPIKITIPNIFTPNGDGYNDFFVIEGLENCTDPQLAVKNSSGKTIFQSPYYQNDWNAENCPDGVYVYYFVYKVNKIEEKMMGKVIIKR